MQGPLPAFPPSRRGAQGAGRRKAGSRLRTVLRWANTAPGALALASPSPHGRGGATWRSGECRTCSSPAPARRARGARLFSSGWKGQLRRERGLQWLGRCPRPASVVLACTAAPPDHAKRRHRGSGCTHIEDEAWLALPPAARGLHPLCTGLPPLHAALGPAINASNAMEGSREDRETS